MKGISLLFKGINDAFNEKLIAADAVAAEFANRAVQQFQQHQLSAKHEPDGKAKPDTPAMKAKAKAYAAAFQPGAPVTAMSVPWTNRSFRAARTVFADHGASIETGVYVSLYHTMSYGAYLELANNRRFATLEPIMRGLAPEFIERIRKIYAG